MCIRDSIRAEGFVFGHVADEGWIDACAGPLLRYRSQIGAQEVKVICDVKKKHSSHAVTSDVDLIETVKAAKFFGSDGVIVTGSATGSEADPTEVNEVKDSVDIPVIVGSGVTDANIDKFANADALIIGSHFKMNGDWRNDLDPERIEKLMNKVLS